MKSLHPIQLLAVSVVGFLLWQQYAAPTRNVEDVESGSAIQKTTELTNTEPAPFSSTLILSPVYEPLHQLFLQLSTNDSEKVANIRDYHIVFADMVRRDADAGSKVFDTSAHFRKYNTIALHLMFKGTNNPNPEILSSIEKELERLMQEEGGVSLSPDNPIDANKVITVMEGIVWAAEKALS